jgi:serine protease Do
MSLHISITSDAAQKATHGSWRMTILLILACVSFSCRNHPSDGVLANSSSSPANVGPAPGSYADVVDRVSPAVVTIRSARRVRAPQQFPFLDDPFFRQLFGDRLAHGGQPQIERALGSGVIVNADGYIVTNHHVVDGAEQITVEVGERRTYEAKLTGSDPPSDLAVL